VQQLIDLLGLEAHPEGGYFTETFRAPLLLDGHEAGQPRHASTCIYFLLPAGSFSAFHAVAGSDEIWHHYLGDPVEIRMIAGNGEHSVTRLGSDLMKGERPQFVVPAGRLQATRSLGETFSLCGCSVAPGFDFEDFAMPSRESLVQSFPKLKELISELTRVS
jgi:predicted cupin superfamily sugar epimerase